MGIAQGNFCLDRQHHYFEMTLISSGKEGWFAIGLACTTYPLDRHLGRNIASVGYSADNGYLYKKIGLGQPFSPTCTEGDMMGCRIDFPVEGPSSTEAIIGATSAASMLTIESDSEDENEVLFDELNQYCYGELFDDSSDENEAYDDEDACFDDIQRELVARKDQQNSAPKGELRDENMDTCLVYFTKKWGKGGRY